MMVIKHSAQHFEPSHTRGLSFVEEKTFNTFIGWAIGGWQIGTFATLFTTRKAIWNQDYSLTKRIRAIGRWASLGGFFGSVVGGLIGAYRAWYLPMLPGLEYGSTTYRVDGVAPPLRDQLWLAYGNEIRTNNVINRRGVLTRWRKEDTTINLQSEEEPWNLKREGVVRTLKHLMQEQGTGDLFDPDRYPRISKPPSFDHIMDTEPFEAQDFTKARLDLAPEHMKRFQCTDCGQNFLSPFQRDEHRIMEHGHLNEKEEWVRERERDADMKQVLWNVNTSGRQWYQQPHPWERQQRALIASSMHPALADDEANMARESIYRDLSTDEEGNPFGPGDKGDQAAISLARDRL